MAEDLQKKLEAYRQRQRRKERIEQFKTKLKDFFMLGTGRGAEGKSDVAIDIAAPTTIKKKLSIVEEVADVDGDDDAAKLMPLSSDDVDDDDNETNKQPPPTELQKQNKWFKYALWFVYTALWTTLYIIAIELKFGIVFLMFSALFGIYFNTRTGPKKANEISAYSVFNKNCESIDGTLKAEQFEREIRYGAGTVR